MNSKYAVEKTTKKTIIVSHVGRRDNYDVAYALQKTGWNVILVTDFYYEENTLIGWLARRVYKDAVGKRYRKGMDVEVRSSVLLYILDVAERIIARNKVVNFLRSYELGRLTNKQISKNGISVGIFYYNSGISWVKKRNKKFKAVLFQMHPYPEHLKIIYSDYLAINPKIRKDIYSEEEELTNNKRYYKILTEEARCANRILCTTEFVKNGLIECGFNASNIDVIPYAARFLSISFCSDGLEKKAEDFKKSNLNIAFVGQFVIRKGAYELIKLAEIYKDINFTIFTRDSKYAKSKIQSWIGCIPNNIKIVVEKDDFILWQKLSSNDYLIVPSLAEGFGLVITEAMSIGLPVIAINNSVAPDLITDGLNGYLYCDFNTLVEKIKNIKFKGSEYRDISIKARERVESMTEVRFADQLNRMLNEV